MRLWMIVRLGCVEGFIEGRQFFIRTFSWRITNPPQVANLPHMAFYCNTGGGYRVQLSKTGESMH